MYVYIRKIKGYVGLGTTCGFRHLLGVLEHMSLGQRGLLYLHFSGFRHIKSLAQNPVTNEYQGYVKTQSLLLPDLQLFFLYHVQNRSSVLIFIQLKLHKPEDKGESQIKPHNDILSLHLLSLNFLGKHQPHTVYIEVFIQAYLREIAGSIPEH